MYVVVSISINSPISFSCSLEQGARRFVQCILTISTISSGRTVGDLPLHDAFLIPRWRRQSKWATGSIHEVSLSLDLTYAVTAVALDIVCEFDEGEDVLLGGTLVEKRQSQQYQRMR